MRIRLNRLNNPGGDVVGSISTDATELVPRVPAHCSVPFSHSGVISEGPSGSDQPLSSVEPDALFVAAYPLNPW